MNANTRFYVGLDLGQSQDPAAIAVVERLEPRRGGSCSILVRHLERAVLGTPYPRIVARVGAIVNHKELRGRCALAVDGTGVGAPVVDMLRGAGLGCELSAVTITGGERAHQAGPVSYVPKRDLIAGMQVMFEQGELKIARRLRDAGALLRELMDVKMSWPGGSGNLRMGADGYGEHDDLVIAVALACWRAKRRQNGFGSRRLPGI
jgi:hypothetical protein